MNTFQRIMQTRADLLAIQLGGSAMFGQVMTSMRRPKLQSLEKLAASATQAIAQIWPGKGVADVDDPSLQMRKIFVRMWMPYAEGGDKKDEEALVGLLAEQGAAGGLEVEEWVIDALRTKGPDNDSGALMRLLDTTRVRSLVNGTMLELRCEAVVVHGRNYPPCSRFTGVDGGGGTADLAWTLAPGRWDRNAVILRRGTNSGDPAPTSSTDGTGIPVGAEDTSVSDTPGTGTWNYALFQEYDESLAQDDSVLQVSSSVTVSVPVV